MKIEPFCAEPISIQKNDVFLLCSDGLTNMLEDEYIQQCLFEITEPKELAEKLLNLALQNGGKDNITILIVWALEDEIAKPHNTFKIAKSKIKPIFFATALLLLGIVLVLCLGHTQKGKPLNAGKASETVTQISEDLDDLENVSGQKDYNDFLPNNSDIYSRRGKAKPSTP